MGPLLSCCIQPPVSKPGKRRSYSQCGQLAGVILPNVIPAARSRYFRSILIARFLVSGVSISIPLDKGAMCVGWLHRFRDIKRRDRLMRLRRMNMNPQDAPRLALEVLTP